MSLKKKIIFGVIALAVIVLLVFFGTKTLTGPKAYTVTKTNFESRITVKGEIQGKDANVIELPDDMKHRDLRIREFQIKDLIKEGSLVKKGDWVATLDIDNIKQQMEYNNDELERRLAEFNDAKIDTAIELNSQREQMKELNYELEYRELDLEQSKYESPAYQRKMQVAYNKTIRQIDKKRRDYVMRQMSLAVRTKRSEDRYNFYVMRDSLLKKALEAAEIVAPEDGMVMYARTRHGRKIKVGDDVSRWNPAIAALPDMSVMISETYVEEIHITKLNIGDSVEITVDALPQKVFKGAVYKIANIGQELPGYDSNVFNVLIELKDSDPELKPAMTSNNDIIINSIPDVFTIPRECLFTENGNDFVFMKKDGEIIKQPVKAGLDNDTEIIIDSGLEEDDKVFYSPPPEYEKNLSVYRIRVNDI
jgi:multidrug efflux pump subunit AcrA (membrane-fusion protein)